jgi:hypothetical protein
VFDPARSIARPAFWQLSGLWFKEIRASRPIPMKKRGISRALGQGLAARAQSVNRIQASFGAAFGPFSAGFVATLCKSVIRRNKV